MAKYDIYVAKIVTRKSGVDIEHTVTVQFENGDDIAQVIADVDDIVVDEALRLKSLNTHQSIKPS